MTATGTAQKEIGGTGGGTARIRGNNTKDQSKNKTKDGKKFTKRIPA